MTYDKKKEAAQLKDFAKRLRQLRGSRTQNEVAEALGTTPNTYARWEQGKHWPSPYMAIRLATFYGVTGRWLVTGRSKDPYENASITYLTKLIPILERHNQAMRIRQTRMREMCELIEVECSRMDNLLHRIRPGRAEALESDLAKGTASREPDMLSAEYHEESTPIETVFQGKVVSHSEAAWTDLNQALEQYERARWGIEKENPDDPEPEEAQGRPKKTNPLC